MSITTKNRYDSKVPLPPEGTAVWPWDNIPTSTIKMDLEWPRISVVTPSYNQAEYIEATIRSVLLQGYPCLEYIVIDGGSSDNSVQIIQKYEKSIAYWVSEEDSGQSHAINKGAEKATGDLIVWLNSDDILLPNSLLTIGKVWMERKPDALTGSIQFIKQNGDFDSRHQVCNPDFETLLTCKDYINQMATFMSLKVWKDLGGVNQDLHYSMDFDLWLRFLEKGHTFIAINDDLAACRLQPDSKTLGQSSPFHEEKFVVAFSFLQNVSRETKRRCEPWLRKKYGTFLCGQALDLVMKGDKKSTFYTLLKAFKNNKGIVFFASFRSCVIRLFNPFFRGACSLKS